MSVTLARLEPWSRPREAILLLLGGATLRTCTPIALVVGSLLSVVNQGDVLVMGMADERVALKIGANLLIPFLTSSGGALLAVRRRTDLSDGPASTKR
jgi:hypothetical protein